ncbi:MAG: tetratricopeptide repeat protein [Bacillota bacterium]
MPLTNLMAYLERGEYLQARREADRLIQTGGLVGESLVQAYRGSALAHYYLQDVFAAIKLGEHALKSARNLGNWVLIGKARYDLGEYHLTLGDYSQAYDYLMQFLADLNHYPALSKLEGWAQHNLALIFRHQRRYEDALAAHHLAAELHKRNGDRRRMLEALRGIVWCHLTRGEPEAAWPYIQQMTQELQESSDDQLASSLLTDMAYYYQQVGDLKASMDFCAEAMAPGRPGVDDHVLATACVIAGENALTLMHCEEALMFANLAQEYALQAKQPVLMNRAVSLKRQLHEVGSVSKTDA